VSDDRASTITVDEVVAELRSHRDEKALAGMAKFGIAVDDACGVSVPEVRALAKKIVAQLGRRNPARHEFAAGLWATGVHEARLLAGMVDLAEAVTPAQMDAWVVDIDSWDVCDQLCMNLFGDTPLAWGKALEWARREEEYVKRAGFALMAVLAWHDKKAPDKLFEPLLVAIEREASDDRNFVKKAVNWALRQIGK
jgi:3-methyladenine DNA glycosylase AlkD